MGRGGDLSASIASPIRRGNIHFSGERRAPFKLVLTHLACVHAPTPWMQAIYMGAVPIVQRGQLDPLYEGMPVLFVDDYKQVSSQLLEDYAAKQHSQRNSTHKAWTIYWKHKVDEQKLLLRGMTA